MVGDKVSKKFKKILSSFQEMGLCLDCKILLSIGPTKSNLCNKEKSFLVWLVAISMLKRGLFASRQHYSSQSQDI